MKNRCMGKMLWLVAALAAMPAISGCVDILGELRQPVNHSSAAFCNVAGLSDDMQDSLVRRIATHNPEYLWCHGAGTRMRAWLDKHGPRRDSSLVRVVTLRSAAQSEPGSEAYTELLDQLALAEEPWKVVLMERSLFLPKTDRERLALARLMERADVSLVISGDGPAYMRTAPVGSNAARMVRYVSLGEAGQTRPEAAAPSILAAATEAPCYAILDAFEDEAIWTVYDVDGKALDAVTVRKGAGPARFLSIMEIKAEERTARQEAATAQPAEAAE